MASKVLVPTAPFSKLQIKKGANEVPAGGGGGGGFVIGGEPAARVAHLEHSVRFLQEQHRLMLGGLHAEIEALRERNRDLQFQLIFNKESSKASSPGPDDANDNEEARLKREITRLEQEAASARGEARAAEARALQLQRLIDAQTQKIRELEARSSALQAPSLEQATGGASAGAGEESSALLRARLADAERLVRRLRGDAERQRRELGEQLQCMKNSLHASLRATGLEPGYYHFPPVHTPDFWREPLREDFNVMAGRGRSRRPLTLPELAATGQHIHRSTVYANNHTRQRPNGYEQKSNSKKGQAPAPPDTTAISTSPHEQNEHLNLQSRLHQMITADIPYPELKIVVAKLLPRIDASNSSQTPDGSGGGRPRPRRQHHRKHTSLDHT